MLKLVPNVETFRDTLRAIKVWAKRESKQSSTQRVCLAKREYWWMNVDRASDLLEHPRFPRWCAMGITSRTDMSTVSVLGARGPGPQDVRRLQAVVGRQSWLVTQTHSTHPLRFGPDVPYNPRRWPQPVLLRKLEARTGVAGSMNLKEWNPAIYPTDRSHLMPIITPAFPVMCSTHNVSTSTMNVMAAEFVRGEWEREGTWDEC